MKRHFFGFMALVLLIMACATTKPESASVQDDLDMAIRKASDYINENVPGGVKLVVLNIKSNYPPLSEYIIDVLTGNVVNDRVFTVVDRANLEQIQQEMEFQLSGEVSDESAQSIGQKLGAQTIVTGSISPFGNLWRLTIRALGVEGATVQGLFNQNISNGASIVALTADGPVTTVAAAPRRTASAQSVASATSTNPAPAPVTYKVGDTGPAGGWIFYDLGFYMNGWRYLEAAPQDFPTRVQWGDLGVLTDIQETGVGTGRQNTVSIVSILGRKGESMRAAQVVSVPEYGGYDDWFLPSKDELILMYENLKKQRVGGFANDVYWSSSSNTSSYIDVGHTGVWQTNFSDGRQNNAHYYNEGLVRAVRAF